MKSDIRIQMVEIKLLGFTDPEFEFIKHKTLLLLLFLKDVSPLSTTL